MVMLKMLKFMYRNDGTIDLLNNLDKDITVNLEAKEISM